MKKEETGTSNGRAYFMDISTARVGEDPSSVLKYVLG